VPVLGTTTGDLDRDLRKGWGLEFTHSPLPMWVFDQTTLAFLAVNDAAVEAYGYSRKQFLAMTILDIRPGEDIPNVLHNALRPHQITGMPEHWRHQRKDGVVMQVEISGRSLSFEGRPAQLICVYKMERELVGN
jgi:two-component system, cell cycle sensor histidine kinase and response regulator CckA